MGERVQEEVGLDMFLDEFELEARRFQEGGFSLHPYLTYLQDVGAEKAEEKKVERRV